MLHIRWEIHAIEKTLKGLVGKFGGEMGLVENDSS